MPVGRARSARDLTGAPEHELVQPMAHPMSLQARNIMKWIAGAEELTWS